MSTLRVVVAVDLVLAAGALYLWQLVHPVVAMALAGIGLRTLPERRSR